EQQLALKESIGLREDTDELGPEVEVELAGGLRAQLKGIGTEPDRNLAVQLRIAHHDYGELLVPASRFGDLQDRPIRMSASPAELGQHAATPAAEYVTNPSDVATGRERDGNA